MIAYRPRICIWEVQTITGKIFTSLKKYKVKYVQGKIWIKLKIWGD